MSNTAKETIQPTRRPLVVAAQPSCLYSSAPSGCPRVSTRATSSRVKTWATIQWAEVERRVLRYQTRIYKATKDKKKEKVRRIQKRLLKSFDAKLLAVRRVTTDNRVTPPKGAIGVDEKLYINDLEKEKLVSKLRLDGYAHPRVYIPKPGKAEKRPLVLTHRRPRAAQEVPKEPSSSSVSYGNTWNPVFPSEKQQQVQEGCAATPQGANEYRQEELVAAKQGRFAPIMDRAKQALCKLVIEPEWEARFEENSYGFRPGRSCHDAIEAIHINLTSRRDAGQKKHHKYILDADITGCFDQINHEYLTKKLDTLPEIKTQVNAWLKAGIMEDLHSFSGGEMVPPNTIGTPQGLCSYSEGSSAPWGVAAQPSCPYSCSEGTRGLRSNIVISPLLANVALHGMENHMKEWICSKPSFNKANSKRAKQQSLAIIRYADDFILIHKNRGIIEEAKEEIAQWLKDGPQLELSETKTSIKNSNEGFNFLGFSCITIRRGNRSRLKIYPSKDSQKRLNLKVRSIIQKNKAASSYNLILLLRPLIIGWSNYFKYSECSYIFNKQSNLTFQKLRAWCFRRDKRNSRSTVKEKYFPSGKSYYFDGTYHKNNWVLTGQRKDKNGILKENYLPDISWVKSKKWVKIKGDASPYDGNNVYWGQRTKKY